MANARDLSGNSPIGGGVDPRIIVPKIYILAASGVPVTKTGDTNENTFATIKIPGGSMGKNGMIRVRAAWSCTNSANNKQMRMRFGGTLFAASTLTTSTTMAEERGIQNRNSDASQAAFQSGSGGFGTSSGAILTGTINTALDQDLTLTGQLSNTGETITLESYLVEILSI